MKDLRHNDGLLRKALYANAMFSLVSGVCFIAFSDLLAHLFITKDFVLFGAGPAMLLMELGILVLGFAALVYLAARQKLMNLIWSCLIIVADLTWVIGSAALLAFAMDFLTMEGAVFVGVAAAFVLDFALVQILGVRRILKGDEAMISGPSPAE